jgi:hypothetical protein
MPITRAEAPEIDQQCVTDLVTSIIGKEEGREEGREEGLEAGLLIAQRSILQCLLAQKFTPIPLPRRIDCAGPGQLSRSSHGLFEQRFYGITRAP